MIRTDHFCNVAYQSSKNVLLKKGKEKPKKENKTLEVVEFICDMYKIFLSTDGIESIVLVIFV